MREECGASEGCRQGMQLYHPVGQRNVSEERGKPHSGVHVSRI